MAFLDLRRILMDILPSCAMVGQGRILRIQTHLEKIRDHLWALNAMIFDAEVRAMKEESACVDWVANVGATMVDLEDLLDTIIERQEKVEATITNRLSSAFLDSTREAFRIRVVCKLKKFRRRLMKLVCRGFAIHLCEDMLHSVDPCRDEYSAILKDEVVGRDEDMEKIIEILQQQRGMEEEEIFWMKEEEEISTQEKRDLMKPSDIIEDLEEEEISTQGMKPFDIVEEEGEEISTQGMKPFDIVEEEISTQENSLSHTVEEAMDEAQNDGPPFVIAICDHLSKFTYDEGIGKTTLARMIYHHPWVKQHFQHRIWVDVSNFISFDVISIAKEFSRAISNEEACSHLQSLTGLQEFWVFLHQRLNESSSYLLILDQLPHFIRDDDWDKWNQLQHTLLCIGGPGSTLVVTTREIDIERFSRANSSSRIYHLKDLSHDAFRELFMKHALISRLVLDREQLEQFSSTNAQMVHRLIQEFYTRNFNYPLTAKIYGSLSRYNKFNKLQKILSDLHRHRFRPDIFIFCDLEDDEKSLMALLFLNYLSAKIGQLNLFYNKFNMVHRDKEEDFMNMMFAEGLTPNSSDKEERQAYLKIKQTIITYDLRDTQYYSVMSTSQNSIIIPNQCFHLCLSFNSNALSFPKALFEENNKLRTLIFLREEKEDTNLEIQKSQTLEIPLEYIFAKLEHLHILHLRDTLIRHLPTTIRKLVHLRYLNVSQTEITNLPRCVCNMWNLQVLMLARCERLKKLSARIGRLWKLKVLDLSYCAKLRMLPTSITSLANLQELYLQGCTWLVQLPEGFSNLQKLVELNIQKCVYLNQMPRGVGQMTNLIRLSGYTACDDNIGIGALAELKTLLHLKALCLQELEKISSSDLPIVEGIKLHEKSMLQTLSLTWQWRDYYVEEEEDVTPEALSPQLLVQLQLIEGLRPNPESLEMLEIVSYMGSKFPSWMANGTEPYLKNLREISLVNLKRCERLPPLGHLLHLEIVEISGMELIDTVDDAFYGKGGTFGNLAHLTFSHMPELEKWIAPAEIEQRHLENLRSVTLIHCPKFKFWEMSQHNWRGTSLEIWLNSRMLLTSPTKYEEWKYYKIYELKIVGCQELRFLPEHMPDIFRGLWELSIIWCPDLISLPDWLEEMKYLERVTICGCTKLSSIPRGLTTRRNLKTRILKCPRLRLN